MGKLRAVVLLVLVVGMLTEKSAADFKDCYTKCFIFCMIEPSQTLCSCTTHCLKDCIFQQIQNDLHDDSDNLGFCKLGCAFSKCTGFSSKRTPSNQPPSLSLSLSHTQTHTMILILFVCLLVCFSLTDGDKVDGCVGSCSNNCIKSYSLP